MATTTFWQRTKAFLADAGSAFREGVELEKIQAPYRKAGHPNPALAAQQEIFLRGEYIERFRDTASDAFMLNGTDLEDSKKTFIAERLSAKTSILDNATTAAVRAVIRGMGVDEAFHPEALMKYQVDMNRWLKETMAEAERTFGKGGFTPLERRVLRGRG